MRRLYLNFQTARSRFFSRLAPLFDHPAAFPLVLLVIAWLSYGVLIPWLGLYGDDPYFLYSYYRFGAESYRSVVGWFRPFAVPFYQAVVPLLGFNIWAYHLLLLALRWLTAFLVWRVLGQVWNKTQAQWAALFCLVYPGFLQQAVPLEFILHFSVMAAFLASLLFMVKAGREPGRRTGLTILSLILALPQFMIEYFVGLELLRPALLWWEIAKSQADKRRGRRFLLAYAPYFAFLLVYAGWRLFVLRSRYLQPSLLETLLSEPVAAMRIMVDEIARYFITGAVLIWGKLFSFPPASTTLVLYLAILLAVGVVLGLYRGRAWTDVPSKQNREAAAMMAGGALVFLAGGVPFWVAQVPVSLAFPWDRTTLGIFMGVGMMAAGVIAYLVKHERQAWVVILIVALATGFHFQNANSFRREWEQARDFFWQMSWRMPGLQPGTLLLSDQIPLNTYPDNSLTPMVNWLYDPDNHSQDVRYKFLVIDARLGGVLPGLEPGAEVEHGGFSGSTSRTVVVYKSVGSCLRVLTNQEALLPALNQNLAQAARLTDLTLIVADPPTPVRPPVWMGAEPSRETWCYAFIQAELAAQQGDWEAVARWGDTSQAKGWQPAALDEWEVFVRGYAHTGDLEQARQLTDRMSAQRDLFPLICGTWRGLVEAGAVPASFAEPIFTDHRCGE